MANRNTTSGTYPNGTRSSGGYNSNGIYRPTGILGPDGRPYYDLSASGPERDMPVPHVIQFAGMIGGAWKTYLHDRWDEAMREGREQALAMRNDCFIQALMQERALATASLKWHIEVDSDRDPQQKAVKDGLTAIIKSTPRLQQMMYYTTDETVWVGRGGSQIVREWKEMPLPVVPRKFFGSGMPGSGSAGPGAGPPGGPSAGPGLLPGMPGSIMGPGGDTGADPSKSQKERRRALTVRLHQPVSGDSIGHKWDGTPYILVHSAEGTQVPGSEIINSTIGRALVLKGTWRDRFILHSHIPMAANFFDVERAEAVHGIGVRSVIFWWNNLRMEWISNVADWCERTGLGVRIWKYRGGDPASRKAMETAAREQDDKVNILVPVFGDRGVEGVDFVDTSSGGADLLLKLQEHVESHIERFIIGQSMSSGDGQGDALGGEGKSKLAATTKGKIVSFDANNLADTVTNDWLTPVKCWTYPDFSDMPAKFVIETDEEDPQEWMQGVKTFVDLGGEVREAEARGKLSLSEVQPGDKLLKGPAAGAPPGGMPGMPPGAPGAPGGEPGQPGAPGEPQPGAGVDQPPAPGEPGAESAPVPGEGVEPPMPNGDSPHFNFARGVAGGVWAAGECAEPIWVEIGELPLAVGDPPASYAKHDVTGEPRDPHGRWTAGADSSRRVPKPAHNLPTREAAEKHARQEEEWSPGTKGTVSQGESGWSVHFHAVDKPPLPKAVHGLPTRADAEKHKRQEEEWSPHAMGRVVESDGGWGVEFEYADMPDQHARQYEAVHAPAGGVTIQGTRYTGGEFIPGDVLAGATKEEKASVGMSALGGHASGDAHKADKIEASKRISAIKDDADKIDVIDEEVGTGEKVSSRDYDEIENRMDSDQLADMEAYLEKMREEWIDEQINNYSPDVDSREIARELDLDRDDIEEKAAKIFERFDLEEPAVSRRAYGADAIQELINDLDDDSPSELRSELEEWLITAEHQMQEAIEQAEEAMTDEVREELSDKYDDRDDKRDCLKRDCLRDFYNDNADLFAAKEEGEHGKWYTDRDGDGVLTFETDSGGKYKVAAVYRTLGGQGVPDMQFSDENKSFSVTGGGEAFQVFSKVVPAIVAYVQKKDLDVATFSAAEPSRRKLYDRLVKTVAAVMPEYFAASIDKERSRYYVIGKAAMKDKVMENVKSFPGVSVSDTPRFFAREGQENMSGWQDITPEIDPAWFTPGGWDEDTQARTAGGGVVVVQHARTGSPQAYSSPTDHLYHGPAAPGPGWTYAGVGPKGGKMWASPHGPAGAAPTVSAPAAEKPTLAGMTEKIAKALETPGKHTIALVAERAGIAPQAASAVISQMYQHGMLDKVKDSKGNPTGEFRHQLSGSTLRVILRTHLAGMGLTDKAPSVKPAEEKPPAGKPPAEKRSPYTPKDYLAQATANLTGTSRTAAGIVDTSASAGKAEKMAEGLTPEKAKVAARENFARTIQSLHDQKDATFSSPEKLMEFVDSIAESVNAGIVKPGGIHRTGDSKTHPYTAVKDLTLARKHFADELLSKINDPKADPIETAGWVEWRLNFTDHLYSDGVGKTSKALGAWTLMRAGMPLPKYRDNAELFQHVTKRRFDPNAGGDSYKAAFAPEGGIKLSGQDYQAGAVVPPDVLAKATKGERAAIDHPYHKWQKYFHSLFRADVQPAVKEIEREYVPHDEHGEDTMGRHALDKDGKAWTPVRQALHDGIVKKIHGGTRTVPAGQDKVYTMLGGGPASGKTSGIDAGVVTLPDHHVMIDSDAIKAELPEYNGLIKSDDDRAAGYAHEESSHIAKVIQAKSFGVGQHVVLDGTGDNAVENVMKKVRAAREAGYKVHAAYMTCSTEEAVRRNNERAKKTGRKPAEDMLRSVHKSVSEVLPQLVHQGAFDHVKLFDSEHEDKNGTPYTTAWGETKYPPTLVMSAEGNTMTVHHPELWESFLKKGQEEVAKGERKEKPTYYARGHV